MFPLLSIISARRIISGVVAAGLFVLLFVLLNRVCEASGAVHPISITEVQMFVTRSKAILRVQMFAEDLILFQGLEPNDQDRLIPEDLKRGLEDHKSFLLEKISLRDANGELLKGQITDMTPFEIPADGIASTDMMQHTATYEIEVPFAVPPEFLTIQQDITDANSIVPSEMSLNIHQAGTGLNFTERLLPGGSTTVRFDWQQELSEDATDEEWDSWFEKQREATLGITSYSSVYSFIYIEPVEMRHEILIPLATLATILPIKHQDAAFVEIGEQDAIREQIRNWLKDANPVVINGTRITPEFTRIDFYSLNLSDFAAQAAAQKVSMASGRVGIIMTYKTPDDSIQDVSQSWGTFYSTMRKVPAVVIAYPNAMSKFEFSQFNTAEANTLTWKCKPEDLPEQISSVDAMFSPRPKMRLWWGSIVMGIAFLVLSRNRTRTARVLRLVLLFAIVVASKPLSSVIDHPWKDPAELSADQATKVFTALHSGLYRSLDFGTEDRIYDALAQTVDGHLLEDLYLQLRQSLELRDQGGAIARIRSVAYDSGSAVARKETVVPWPGFQYKSTWTVSGTVEHWGHVHERQNQFDAVFTIEPRVGHWKITRMDVAGQTQKSARTTLRKF